jgi:hypothetical protein
MGTHWTKKRSENQFIEPERPKICSGLSSGRSGEGMKEQHGITSKNDKVAIINHRTKENHGRLLIRKFL